MTDISGVKPALGTAIHAIAGKWGWFIALGVGELVLGGIASVNLMAATLASVLLIGASMVAAGIFQIVHAFSARGLGGFLYTSSESFHSADVLATLPKLAPIPEPEPQQPASRTPRAVSASRPGSTT